jgi:hypothetical protein
LDAYRTLLEVVLNSDRARRARLTRLAAGTERFLVAHVRTVLDVVERRYLMRAATGMVSRADEADARCVHELARSLPPPASRLWLVAAAGIVLAVAQLLFSIAGLTVLSGLTSVGSAEQTQQRAGELTEALSRVAGLDVSNAGQATQLLLRTDVTVASLVLIGLLLSTYLVLRPLANGLIVSRALCRSDAMRPWHGVSKDERTLAARLRLNQRESTVLARLELARPRETTLDLIVPGLLAAAVLLIALNGWMEGLLQSDSGGASSIGKCVPDPCRGRATNSFDGRLTGGPAPIRDMSALVVGCLAAMRLGWLVGRRWQRAHPHETGRRSSLRHRALRSVWPVALAGVAAAVAGAGFLRYASSDHQGPQVALHVSGRSQEPVSVLRVVVRCREPCVLRGATLVQETRFLGVSRAVSPAGFSRLSGSGDPWCNAPRELYGNDCVQTTPSTLQRHGTVELRLTSAQASWLQWTALRSTFPSGGVEIDVADARDNRTRLTLGL